MIDWDSTAWVRVFFLSEWAVRLIMLVIIPLRRTPAAAKGWLLLVFFEPWVGLALYLLFGRARTPRWRRRMLAKLPSRLAGAFQRLQNDPHIERPILASHWQSAVELAENLGHMPILGRNGAEFIGDYQGAIDRLVADIDAAKNHVHLLYFIFADDPTGQKIADALGRAVERGVKCRVLMDSVGSRSALRTLAPRMRAVGIEVYGILPIGLFRRKMTRFDLRNHRKIATIDGRVAYTGSQNIVDAKVTEDIIHEELVVRFTGPVVLELQYVFVSDWFLETEEVLDSADVFPSPQPAGDVSVQVLASGPDYPTQNNQFLFVALIHAARRKVTITTPYFVPDEPLLQAIETAAHRGVEVQLIVSRKLDHLMVGLAQRSYYEQLLEAKVRIYLYREKLLHVKALSVDDSICIVGSSNMDIRSFQLNCEISAIVYDERATLLLSEYEERYMTQCEALDRSTWRRRPFLAKFAELLARLMSPLL